MGCWYQTDYVSKLPIRPGEEVVVIMLKPNKYSEGYPHNCYTTDNFIPFGYPIYGEYDDYGSVENVTNIDDIVSYLEIVELYKKVCDFDENIYKYEKVKVTKDNFYEVIRLLSEGGLYFKDYIQPTIVKTPTSVEMGPPEEKYILADLMFIKRDLYDELIKEVERRITYDGTTILESFKKHLDESLTKMRKYEYCSDEDATDGKLPFLAELNISSSYPNTLYWRSDDDCIRIFIFRKLIKEFDEAQFDYLKNINMFTTALMFLRTGYYITTGDGSQALEMLMHKKLAEYIIRQTDNAIERYRSFNDDDATDEEIITEKISY